MADEHYRWLDADAVERLLRGEPLEAVDADTREQVERLAGALDALIAEPAPNSDELPGEAAALAAFRKARENADGAAAPLGRRDLARSAAHAADAGLVRIGRPAAHGRRTRWGRPTRIGLAAVLAAGMVGGVAVAAGTGALPTPFTRQHPDPAASVTAIRTPDRPLGSPGPTVSGGIGSVVPSPDGPSGRPSGDAPTTAGPDTADASGRPGDDATESADRDPAWLNRARTYCRDVLDGKDLAGERRQLLEHAAGGGRRIKLYCAGLLGRRAGAGDGKGAGDDGKQGSGRGSGQDGRDDRGDQGDDDGHHIGRGNDPRGNGGVVAPVRPGHPAPVRRLPVRPGTSPAPRPAATPLPAPSP
ncbi:hypothetical protein ACIP5U_30855 [Streptomyces sp. NPDC088788]|uniref:hypothetical protein n=1 Tax=Streptomyces sp. NPDC088788 TaxID=3365898 RepID=UPI00381CA524